MELVVWVVAGVALLWLFTRGRGNATSNAQPISRPQPTSRTEAAEKTPNEKLADSLESLREAIREKADADSEAMRDQLEDADHRLAEAAGLADELGISDAITRIADEMEHWHSWSTGESFSKLLVDGLRYVSGTHTHDKQDVMTVHEFAFGNRRYRMSVIKEQYASNRLSLEQFNGSNFVEVFAAEICKDDRDLARWEIRDVTRIDVGEWIHDMVALEEHFAARRHRDALSRELEHKLPKVKNLKLSNEFGDGSSV